MIFGESVRNVLAVCVSPPIHKYFIEDPLQSVPENIPNFWTLGISPKQCHVYSMLALALPKPERSNRSSDLIRNSYLLDKQMIIDERWKVHTFFGYQDQREWLLTFGLEIIILQGVSSRKCLEGVIIMVSCRLRLFFEPAMTFISHKKLRPTVSVLVDFIYSKSVFYSM
jgi:hypothetical protein